MMNDLERARLSRLENLVERLKSGGGAGSEGVAFISVKAFGAKGDGVTDDTAAIQKAFNTCAPLGLAVWFDDIGGHGTYLVSAPITVPSFLIVWGSPHVIIKSTIVTGGPGSFSKTVFIAVAIAGAVSTTLAANTTKGADTATLTSSAGFTSGAIVLISRPGSDNVAQQFRQIGAPAGAVITLDDQIEFGFQAGDAVSVLTSVPTKIMWFGNGMQISGTGDQAFEFAAADRCWVQDVVISRTFGSFSNNAISFDIAGRDNTWTKMKVDGGGVCSEGISLESNVRSAIHLCDAWAVTSNGFWLPANARIDVDACNAWQCANGLALLDGGGADQDACQRYSIRGCKFYGNTGSGLVVAGGSQGQIVATQCQYNVVGITLQSDTEGNAPNGIDMVEVDVSNNSSYGVIVSNNAIRWSAVSLRADACGAAGVQIAGTGHIELHNYESDDAAVAINIGAAADVVVVGGRLRQVAKTGGWDGIILNAAAELRLDGTTIEKSGGTGTSIAIDVGETAGAVSYIANLRTIGALSFGLFNDAVASTCYIEEGTDVTSCTTPLSLGSSTSSMAQDQGMYQDATATGAVTLTQVQARTRVHKLTGNLTGNLTYNWPVNLQGLMVVVDASGVTLNGHTLNVGPTGGTVGITAAQHIVYSDGTNAHTVV